MAVSPSTRKSALPYLATGDRCGGAGILSAVRALGERARPGHRRLPHGSGQHGPAAPRPAPRAWACLAAPRRGLRRARWDVAGTRHRPVEHERQHDPGRQRRPVRQHGAAVGGGCRLGVLRRATAGPLLGRAGDHAAGRGRRRRRRFPRPSDARLGRRARPAGGRVLRRLLPGHAVRPPAPRTRPATSGWRAPPRPPFCC